MNMLETVARAIAKKYGDPDTIVCPYVPQFLMHERLGVTGLHAKAPDSSYAPLWLWFIPDAKSVLETMRSPTADMQHAGLKALDKGGLGDCNCDQHAVWDAMIDAALRDIPSSSNGQDA